MIRPIYPDRPQAPRCLMYAVLISLFCYLMVGISLVMATSVYPDRTDERREYRAMLEDNFLKGAE